MPGPGVKACGAICLFALYLFLMAGCAPSPLPFTRHLTQEMTFGKVLMVAREEGYGAYSEVARYKGYRLLSFRSTDDGQEVFLVVNNQGKPMLRTLDYDRLDEEKLVNFVDDLLQHNNG